VTSDDLAQALAAYAAGLDAEMSLLEQMHALSLRQRDASHSTDPVALEADAEARRRLVTALVTVEHELKPVRAVIADARARLAGMPAFRSVAERHRSAAELVARIIVADQETLAALREAEAARRFAAQAIEAGENTLAAYRRIISPPLRSAALIDERG
jgi:hypothetical protein